MAKNGKFQREPASTAASRGGAKRYEEIMNALQTVPEVRVEKIKRLRREILNGTYVVDAYAVAGKMLKEVYFDF